MGRGGWVDNWSNEEGKQPYKRLIKNVQSRTVSKLHKHDVRKFYKWFTH